MKPTEFISISKKILLGTFVLIILISFSSCATKAKFLTSTVVPAARGDVQVKQNKNKNYVINIEITDLAEVERLQPSRNTYVVWLVTEQDETKNLGQMKSSSGTFSNNLKASFETVSSTKPSKIFITAEDDGTTHYPSGEVVLTTNRF